MEEGYDWVATGQQLGKEWVGFAGSPDPAPSWMNLTRF